MDLNEKIKIMQTRYNQGHAIKCIMNAYGIGVRELARSTNYSPTYICQMLSGERGIPKGSFDRISQSFNLPVSFIESVVSYYSSLDNKYDELSKDQFTMLYILETVQNASEKTSLTYNPNFTDDFKMSELENDAAYQ